MVLELKRAADIPKLCITECAHIFPGSNNVNILVFGGNAQSGKFKLNLLNLKV